MAALGPADLALVLMAACSASVTFEEFNLIAGGMAAALRDKQVVQGLIAGPHHLSLMSILLFSGANAQNIVVDWTPVGNESQAAAFADAVDNMPRILRPGLTAIGNALAAAGVLLDRLPTRATRRLIDIAGDGRANDGAAPAPIRDALVAQGITINGLCILHEEPDLLETFHREVIGGTGSFAQICADYKDFAEAMRRKLLREISDKPIV